MVSGTDTTAQVHTNKADVEAAFKSRFSFESSDAFKQIFSDIQKKLQDIHHASHASAQTASASSAPVSKDDHKDANDTADASKTHRKHHMHHAKHKDDDKAKVPADKLETSKDDVTRATAEPKPHHVKGKKCHTDDEACEDDVAQDAPQDDALATAQATQDTTDEKVTTGEALECDKDASGTTADQTNTPAANAELGADEQVLAQQVTITSQGNEAGAAAASVQLSGNKELAVLHHMLGTLRHELAHGMPQDGEPSTKSDAAKDAAAEETVAALETPATGDAPTQSAGQDAPDELFAALKAKMELVKSTQVQETQENAKAAREAVKAANDKHADHIDALQGQFSAPETRPAAGNRAISVAVTATDSSAPSQHGSAGGGTPIHAKLDASLAHLGGLSVTQGAAQEGQITFAGVMRAGKEAATSMMTANEQIAVHLNRMAKTGATQYDLQLHPAELGRVDIRLEISKDGAVQATVTADNQQTFDMLQRDSRSLERALQQAGLQADSGSLSFNLRGDQGSLAQQQAQNQHGSTWNKWMQKTLPEEAAPSKVLAFDVAANGRVDLRV